MSHPTVPDMNLVCRLMLQIDNGKHAFQLGVVTGVAAPHDATRAVPDVERLGRHLTWIEDQGLVEFDHRPGGLWTMRCVTSHGHAFLAAARDSMTDGQESNLPASTCP